MQNTNLRFGVAFSLLSFFLLAIMSSLAKVAANYESVKLIVFVQNFVSFLIILPFAIKAGISQLKTKRIYLHIIRAVTGTMAWFFLFESIKMTSLNMGVLLCYAAPLWIPVIAAVFFKEKVHSKVWLGVVIGLVGIAFVLGLHLDQNPNIVGFGFGIFAGLMLALALISIRLLNITEKTTTILFYYFLISSLLLLTFCYKDLPQLNLQSLPYLIAIGVCLAISQLCIVTAYKYASTVKLSPYIYSTIIFSTLIDSLVWHTLITSAQLAGMLLVILGGVIAMQQSPKEDAV